MDQLSSKAALRLAYRFAPYIAVAVVSILCLVPGLGSASKLTYHEAFLGQGAREMLSSGDWSCPTIGGRPWLEKPPLPWWLVSMVGRFHNNGLTEMTARLPSAIAASLLALGVTVLARRNYGATIGFLAGAVQATTAWHVMRGRLAEADILLACVFTWTIIAFERLRSAKDLEPRKLLVWRGLFFGLLGATSLIKGIGFGAVLILGVVTASVIWDRDRLAYNRLRSQWGWGLAALIALAWPLAMILKFGPSVLRLWTLHVTDRLSAHPEQFASESWWQYAIGIGLQALPWAPFALVGAVRSLPKILNGRSMPIDRLLWVWAVVPLILLSLATVKNAHYAIYAQVPWSIWTAFGLMRLADRLRARGWRTRELRGLTVGGFLTISLGWGLGFSLLGSSFDRRGVEWAFYEDMGRRIPPDEPVAFLYDDWDRNPYPTPFGPVPHDLAVRLYYLQRRASWHFDQASLAACGRSADGHLAVIGRERDQPTLAKLGYVEVLAGSPAIRFDRTYLLMRVSPQPKTVLR